jgi:hypothetical protein
VQPDFNKRLHEAASSPASRTNSSVATPRDAKISTTPSKTSSSARSIR